MHLSPPPPSHIEYVAKSHPFQKIKKRFFGRSSKKPIFKEERRLYRAIVRPMNRAICVMIDRAIQANLSEDKLRKLEIHLLSSRLEIIRQLGLEDIEREYFCESRKRKINIVSARK